MKDNFKIVMVAPRYLPSLGGIEKHVSEIAENLRVDIDVKVLSLDPDIQTSFVEETIHGVKVVKFKPKKTIIGVEFPPSKLLNVLRSSNPDIVHLHGLHSLLPEMVLKFVVQNGCKFIITPHYHGFSHHPVRNLLLKIYKKRLGAVLSQAQTIICVSEFERTLLRRDFQVQAEKMIVIPNGVDRPKPDDHSSASHDPLRLLFVGRLEKYKNVDKLLKALSILPQHHGFKLCIVGKGPERNFLTSVAQSLGVSDRVEMKMNLTAEELESEYQSSGIFVMPSIYEAHGIAVVEALNAGLKVIVANTSALSEFVAQNCAYGISLPITHEKLARSIQDISEGKMQFDRYPVTEWSSVAHKVRAEYSKLLTTTLPVGN